MRHTMARPASAQLRRTPMRGTTLLEVTIAVSVLAVGLLAHVAATSSEHRLAAEQETRSHALLAAEQLLERMRAEPDWAGLYDRLRTIEESASASGGSETRLADGRKAFTPQTYYPDFVLPASLATLRVLVELPPRAPLDAAPTGPSVFREDVVAPEFGLPADLNADGAVDGMARESDYVVVPLQIRLRWDTTAGGAAELRLPAWLGGVR